MFKSSLKTIFMVALVGLIVLEPADRRQAIKATTSNVLHAGSKLLNQMANWMDPPQIDAAVTTKDDSLIPVAEKV